MGKIFVIGLGPGDPSLVSLAAYERMKSSGSHFVRTREHGAVKLLDEVGTSWKSFDSIYERANCFEEVYEEIVRTLLEEAEKGDVNYYVPGDPHVAERTVVLLEETNQPLEIIAGISFIEPVLKAVKKDSVEGLLFLNGETLTRHDANIHMDLLITQVYNQHGLSEVKLCLSEIYGDDYEIYVVKSAGTDLERIQVLPLWQLDREVEADAETAIYIPKMPEDKKIYDMRDLWEVMEKLRGPDGCPWDREQTHESIKLSLVEEAYELLETIENGDIEAMVEELGDYLLQVVFHAIIGYENGEFYPIDITTILVEKLIYRHPHIFLQKKVANSTDVRYNWDELKYDRRKIYRFIDKLRDIPALPSTMVAQKLIKKSAEIGFIWDSPQGPRDKVLEELDELELAREQANPKEMERELGDVLFSVCSLAFMLGVEPESALRSANRKFIRRMEIMDELARQENLQLEALAPERLEKLWDRAKGLE